MKKNKGGRPSKYKPEYCRNLVSFFDIEPIIYRDITITYKDGSTKELSEAEGVQLPFFSAWCRKIGISTETMHEWIKRHKEFSDAYKKAKECQEEILITCALKNCYNSTFSIFTMKNICGWRDEQHVKGEGFTNVYNVIQQIQRDFQKDSGSPVELDTRDGLHNGRTRQIERHQEVPGQTISKDAV